MRIVLSIAMLDNKLRGTIIQVRIDMSAFVFPMSTFKSLTLYFVFHHGKKDAYKIKVKCRSNVIISGLGKAKISGFWKIM